MTPTFAYALFFFFFFFVWSIWRRTKANYPEYFFLKGLGQNKPRVEESRLFRKCVGAELRERRENKINTLAQGGVNVRKNSLLLYEFLEPAGVNEERKT